MRNGRTDIPRLIRVATFLASAVAAITVYVAYEPRVDELITRIDTGGDELLSDDAAFRSAALLRSQYAKLSAHYSSLEAHNPEAVFVRELATTVRRHGVSLVTTSATQEQESSQSPGGTVLFGRTLATLELRGPYRALLATIADLSMGSAIVEVRESSLHRDGNTIVADVPVVIYESLRVPISTRRTADAR